MNQLIGYEIGLTTLVGMLVNVIWEKEHLQDGKDND
jgi:hypothetical protein